MSKIGVKLQINMDGVDQSKIFKGKKGNYLNLVTFIDLDVEDEYGNSGMVKQEADKGVEMPILGNTSIFWRG